MHNRLNQNDVTNQVNVEDADQVRDAVVRIFSARYPGADFAPMARAFNDVKALFAGNYPGYLPCDTLYHDARHTLDMTLGDGEARSKGHDRSLPGAMALGARRAALGRGDRPAARLGLHAPLLRRRKSRTARLHQGARQPQRGFPLALPADHRLRRRGGNGRAPRCTFTGYEMDVDDIKVPSPKDRLLGYMVGTADLIGQMSDRMYLEKCREFLYQEFVLGLDRARDAAGRARDRALLLARGPDLQDAGLLRVRRARPHQPQAGRNRPLGRGALRRAEPLPERNRQQHELPARRPSKART
jgi:hypothetical protein